MEKIQLTDEIALKNDEANNRVILTVQANQNKFIHFGITKDEIKNLKTFLNRLEAQDNSTNFNLTPPTVGDSE